MASAPSYSTYYLQLADTARERYREKLQKLGGLADPYLEKSRDGHSSVDWQLWPEVEYPDIYNFLIATPSLYTGDSLKAYKSLDAYNYYTSGWVDNVMVFTIHCRPGTFLVTARVKHSQKLSAPPVKPWVAVEQQGMVVCAHCTCMAGLGEACSHVAALLFVLEANTQVKRRMACTSMPCSWLPPSFRNVPYAQLSDINFSNPHQGRKNDSDSSNSGECSKVSTVSTSTPSQDELHSLYRELSKSGKPVLLSLVPEFSESYVPMCMSGTIPQPLTDHFDKSYLDLSYPDLLNKCEEFYSSYSITPEQAKTIEEKSREQSKSRLWFQQRAGRVTASKLKSAVHTDIAQPSQSLIKSICYPESYRFKSQVTSWGCEHETTALKEYKHQQSKTHTDLHLSKSGFCVHHTYPFMGASPDSLVTCSCCGNGVIEVKCPYSCRDKGLVEKSKDSRFFLKAGTDGKIALDTSHAYYYQVQAQLKFCDAKYCDFVVWRERELFIQRIYPDSAFVASALVKCELFVKVAILPELLGKWYSKEPIKKQVTNVPDDHDHNNQTGDREQAGLLWCYCRKGEFGQMIGCDSTECHIQWFHTSCLRITKIPKGKWFCPDCRKVKRS